MIRFLILWRNAFTLFFEGAGGRLAKIGRGPHAHATFASAMLDAGFLEPGREYLEGLVLAFPRDRMLRLLLAAALVQTGDEGSGRAQAERVIAGAPPDTLTAMARGLLARTAKPR